MANTTVLRDQLSIPLGALPMLGAPGPDPGLLLLLADADDDLCTFPRPADIDEALAMRCASL